MARPRKPTAIMELVGAYRKNPQRRPQNEPEPRGPFPDDPPGHLPPELKAAWQAIVDVVPVGVLQASDIFVV